MKIHIVQKGDTLYKIAHAYGVSLEELMEMNQHLSDPNMLMPGMKIHIPANTDKVAEQAKKETKQAKKMEKTAPQVTERRPRHHVEMDDQRPHKVPSLQERPTQPMMPQAMPMPRNPQARHPGMHAPEAMIYCCCCNQYHQIVPIQPFKDNIQRNHSAQQSNLQTHHQEVDHKEYEEKHSVHKEDTKPKERQSRVINESYFTNDTSFY